MSLPNAVDAHMKFVPLSAKDTSLTHSVEDLWEGIPEEDRINYKVRNPIRPVIDPYVPPDINEDLNKRMKDAFVLWQATRARYFESWINPSYTRFIDRIRWSLHKALLRWKVII